MADLARALVLQGVLGAEDASRAAQAARNGDVASAALDLGLAEEAALVRALAREYECPGVELSRSAVPVSHLDVLPAEFCRTHRVLPLTVGRVEVALAMADPDDLPVADEARFM